MGTDTGARCMHRDASPGPGPGARAPARLYSPNLFRFRLCRSKRQERVLVDHRDTELARTVEL